MIYKVQSVYGKIKNKSVKASVPGSKSIAARALVCAALAKGTSVIYNLPLCDDSLALADCLRAMGVKIGLRGTCAEVEGCGGDFPVKNAVLNVRSSGAAARFAAALAAFSDGEYLICCSEQMKRRPVLPLLKSLEAAGAAVESGGGFPLKIKGNRLRHDAARTVNAAVDITESSQFLSALMLASALSEKPAEITFSGVHSLNYAVMTERVMRAFGAKISKTGATYSVSGGLSPAEYAVEPDASSACYFYAANKILGADIEVNLPQTSLQCDLGFIEFLKDYDGGKADMSGFSDQTLTLAAIAPFFGRPVEITGVPHIKKQECDRLFAIRANLSAMGVRSELSGGGVTVYPSQPRPAVLNSFGDHRVAMAFAVTGLRAEGIAIQNAEVCGKSFKDFFGVLNGVCAALTE